MTERNETARKPRIGLSAKTLIGLILGVLCGLFFGEICGRLEVVGNAFIGLLQMAVLPYIVVSLVASVGHLTPGQAWRISGRALVVVLLLWAITMTAVVLMSVTFPPRQSAAFFSSRLLETPESIDLVEMFIPANPFRALADNLIPAVVVFCVGVGIALMQVVNKSVLLEQLDSWLDVFSRLNGLVVRLTPFGVWAIASSASGTMTTDQVNQLQAYLLSYTAAVIIIAFFVLPALITACTHFRYRDILDVTFQAMLTAFVTDKLIVVLPLLVEKTRELFANYHLDNDEVVADTKMIYPLIYPIPNMGKLLALAFVPFAAWFVGNPMASEDFPSLVALGSITFFGRPIVAIPFLLDAFRLPIDMFQLFLVTGVYCARIGDVLAVMNLFTVTVLATCWSQGTLKVRPVRLVASLTMSIALSLVAVVGLRSMLTWTTGDLSTVDSVVAEMHNLRHPSPAIVHETIPKKSDSLMPQLTGLKRIKQTKTIRVGYIKNNLPYSYFNTSKELVGLDVDMAHLLAEELACRLEFVPFEYSDLALRLNERDFDVAMTGMPMTTDNLLQARFSEPYMYTSWALVVPDHRRKLFETVDLIKQLKPLVIAIPPGPYFYGKTRHALPQAKLVNVDSPDDFFSAPEDKYDALLMDAEGGSAWTFLHPEYCVVIPKPRIVKQPMAYAVNQADSEFADFLSQWIRLKSGSGEFDDLYRHWILGDSPKEKKPRWSILNDVMRVSEEPQASD